MCVAIPYRVVEVREGLTAAVRRGDRVLHVSLLAAGERVQVGDWVLVHSGLVLCTLTTAEAAALDAMPTDGGLQ